MHLTISTILLKYARQGAALAVALILLSLNGCVYRFTNLVSRPPKGVRSIAVEAIYDTSREVLPRDVIWEAMQRTIAENGKMVLVDSDSADALIRLHISSAELNPSGSITRLPLANTSDPDLRDKPSPTRFRDLTRSGSYTDQNNITISVRYEVVHLETRQQLKSGSHTESINFLSIRPGNPKESYLIFEESLAQKLRYIATNMSRKVVNDLLL